MTLNSNTVILNRKAGLLWLTIAPFQPLTP